MKARKVSSLGSKAGMYRADDIGPIESRLDELRRPETRHSEGRRGSPQHGRQAATDCERNQWIAELFNPLVAELGERHAIGQEHQIPPDRTAIVCRRVRALGPERCHRPGDDSSQPIDGSWASARSAASLRVVSRPFGKHPSNACERPNRNVRHVPVQNGKTRLDLPQRGHEIGRQRCRSGLRRIEVHKLGRDDHEGKTRDWRPGSRDASDRLLERIFRAGTPAQISLAGTLFVTTEFAPTTELTPITMPGPMKTLAPIQAPAPIDTFARIAAPSPCRKLESGSEVSV